MKLHLESCWMSHSVTCLPTEVNTPHLNPSYRLVLYSLPRGMESWVDLGDRLHTEMVYPPTDSHPSKYKPGSARPGGELATCW